MNRVCPLSLASKTVLLRFQADYPVPFFASFLNAIATIKSSHHGRAASTFTISENKNTMAA